MNAPTTSTQRLVLAAVTGLALGASGCKSHVNEVETSAAPLAQTAPANSAGKACCKGLNDCKGKGGCGVNGKHDCAGQNACKGQGGCDMHCPKKP